MGVIQTLLRDAENSMLMANKRNDIDESLSVAMSGTLPENVERGPWHSLAATRRWRGPLNVSSAIGASIKWIPRDYVWFDLTTRLFMESGDGQYGS